MAGDGLRETGVPFGLLRQREPAGRLRRVALSLAAVWLLAAAGCGQSPTAPTPRQFLRSHSGMGELPRLQATPLGGLRYDGRPCATIVDRPIRFMRCTAISSSAQSIASLFCGARSAQPPVDRESALIVPTWQCEADVGACYSSAICLSGDRRQVG